MDIRLMEDGTWMGIESDTEAHVLTAEEKVLYADQIAAIKENVGNWQNIDRRLKAVVMGLVKTINLRLPAGQKIKAAELKEAIKEEL